MEADDESKDPQIMQALRESKELDDERQRKRRKVEAEEDAQMKQAIQASLFSSSTPTAVSSTPTAVLSSGVSVKSEDHVYECNTDDEFGGAPIAEVVTSHSRLRRSSPVALSQSSNESWGYYADAPSSSSRR